MLPVYLPVLLMLTVAVIVPVTLYVLATVLGPSKPSAEKMIPYESGSPSDGVRLSVKFYLTAILFVVFDIEAVFLYPWAANFREYGWFGFVEMVLFIVVLVVTLVYAWRKGALEWER
jgi:NADH-quinone oxidoreductase subunit A